MGLAPYGEPKYNLILNNLIDVKDDGSFRLNQIFNYSTGLTMINEEFEGLFKNKHRNPKTEE